MLQLRNMLREEEISKRSRLVQELIMKSREFKSAKIIGLYFATGSEVRTDLLIGKARKLGRQVALPRTEGDRINFYEMQSVDELVAGRFGIMEPLPAFPVERMDLLVVPGIAFDRHGYRLGYGKGYYDRFLSEGRAGFAIGLAYTSQLLDSLPRGEHDSKLDAVATENEILYFG